jgi:hypothetical protein
MIHNNSPSNIKEFFDGKDEGEDESEDEDSIFSLSFMPHCNNSGDNDCDFGDDTDWFQTLFQDQLQRSRIRCSIPSKKMINGN